MILPVFLQITHSVTITRSELTAIYIVLGGTIFSALLAACVSIWAARRTSATARDVADLNARTTLNAADIASNTAKELKDRDYRDDYYKKIIEKRFQAWQAASCVVELMTSTMSDKSNGLQYFSCFANGQVFDQLLDEFLKLPIQALWLSPRYGSVLQELHNTLLDVRRTVTTPEKFNASGFAKIDDAKLRAAGIKDFKKIDLMLSEVMAVGASEIRVLHKVEEFFENLPSEPEHIGSPEKKQSKSLT